jgi:3-oxoacyl-[acyl-carrier protein] reductase
MDLKLSGRVALVTGASRGLGRAIALRLAHEGMHVGVAARDKASLDGVVREITAAGGKAIAIEGDLSQLDGAEKAVAATVKAFGKLNLLVNNAGATKRGDFLKLTDADWADGFALKFFGAVGGRTGEAEFTIGGSVNAAIALFTKALSDRGIKDGVRVLAIHPGTFETERFQKRLQTHMDTHKLSKDAAYKEMLKEARVARFGAPDELATFIAMLASDELSYLQGSIIDMDGGQTRAI